jgi:nucleotide-binding universal stress UspA family protein
MYTKILAANDGSSGGRKAFAGAIELARKISAELHMVTVEELPRFPASIDEVAEEKDEANHRFAPSSRPQGPRRKGPG